MTSSPESTIPPGFKLLHTLRGHQDVITQLAWSPNGTRIASSSKDRTIKIWAADSGELLQELSDLIQTLHEEGKSAYYVVN